MQKDKQKRRRLSDKEKDEQLKTKIRDARRYITSKGFFVHLDSVSDSDEGDIPDRHLTSFFRGVIDQALADVLASSNSEERHRSLEWFCTSAFDQTCHYADLEVDMVFSTMQNIFNHYKDSKYGKDWKKPNLTTRVSIYD